MKLRRLIAFTILLVTMTSMTNAGVIVSVQNATVSQGGNGYVDVLISSDSADSIAGYYFTAVISGTPAGLTFRDDLDQEDISASFVFSSNVNALYSTASIVLGTAELEATAGGDNLDGDGFNVDFALSSTPVLAARFSVTASNTAVVGSTLTVTISGTPDSEVYDQNWDFNPPSPITPTYNTGTVTISSAVPEPSTMAMLCMASCFAFRKRRR